MIPRYQSSAMRMLWSDDHKYATWFLVERRYLASYFDERGEDDKGLLKRLEDAALKIDWQKFAEHVGGYDEIVKHDVIAFLHALEDELNDDARLIHKGLTSSDIVDTAFAYILHEANQEILQKLRKVITALYRKASALRGVMCLGRTHGQAAEPMTLGIKFLSHLCEFARGYHRLARASQEIACGKLSGAVGIYAHTTPTIESSTLARLGLSPETISTQIVARDRHAAYFTTLAVLAGSIERFAVEIRLLAHGQIKEVAEPFSSSQKGSSAMPHKKNPILSENLCGLMRMVRTYALSALENQALWHERDISHSSVERIIAPDATSLMDFALARLVAMIDNLVVDTTRVEANLTAVGGQMKSQALMLALVDKGLPRQKSYEMVQVATLKTEGQSLSERLHDAGITSVLGEFACEKIVNDAESVVREDELYARAHEAVKDIIA